MAKEQISFQGTLVNLRVPLQHHFPSGEIGALWNDNGTAEDTQHLPIPIAISDPKSGLEYERGKLYLSRQS